MGLCILKARQGLFAEAIQFGESGLRETEKVNDGWFPDLFVLDFPSPTTTPGTTKSRRIIH